MSFVVVLWYVERFGGLALSVLRVFLFHVCGLIYARQLAGDD